MPCRLPDAVIRTQRSLDVGPDEAVPAVALDSLLAEPGDPALRQANADVDVARPQRRDHVPGARGEGDGRRDEAIVLLREVERRGEVLGHETDAQTLRGHCLECDAADGACAMGRC